MQNEIWNNQSNDSTSFLHANDTCSSTTRDLFFYCILSFCLLVGTPGHLWCLWFYLHGSWRIKANQMFLIHHIIIELIGCVGNAIEFIFFIFLHGNKTVFIVTYFIFYVSMTGRTLIQTCICIEQYIAVIHPIIFLKYKDIKYKLAGVVTVYLISFSYAVYGINYLTFPDYILSSICFLAVILMLFCCVSVLCALKTSGPGDKHGNRSTAQEEPNQQKKKAFNIICTNLFITLCIYVPIIALFIGQKTPLYCILSLILLFTTKFSLIITPLLKIYKESNLRCLNQRD